jgi:hypothetical protein
LVILTHPDRNGQCQRVGKEAQTRVCTNHPDHHKTAGELSCSCIPPTASTLARRQHELDIFLHAAIDIRIAGGKVEDGPTTAQRNGGNRCDYRRPGPLHGGPPLPLSSDRRSELAAGYARRAVQRLREGCRGEAAEVYFRKNAPDLAILRSRPDYRKLLDR